MGLHFQHKNGCICLVLMKKRGLRLIMSQLYPLNERNGAVSVPRRMETIWGSERKCIGYADDWVFYSLFF